MSEIGGMRNLFLAIFYRVVGKKSKTVRYHIYMAVALELLMFDEKYYRSVCFGECLNLDMVG